jgi:RsiW-degrading membrane proteinase PrsW (M82 family)
MAFLAAVLLSFAPALFYATVVYQLDRFEKEPKHLLGGVFLWGAVVAVVAAVVAQVILAGAFHAITGSKGATSLAGATLFAPITEEALKAFAVFIVFAVFRHEFDSVLDGIVYAGVVALGFAATENVLYLYNEGYAKGGAPGLMGLFFLRVVMGAWDHPFYTAFTGIGLALCRLAPSLAVKLVMPVTGYVVAVFFHGLHNGLAAVLPGRRGALALLLLVDWSGWAFMAAIIVWAFLREKRLMTSELAEEVDRGTLTAAQYRTATSAWSQTGARLGALGSGRMRATHRFYHLLGELAHKKHHLATLGEEEGNSVLVARLRRELAALAPLANI